MYGIRRESPHREKENGEEMKRMTRNTVWALAALREQFVHGAGGVSLTPERAGVPPEERKTESSDRHGAEHLCARAAVGFLLVFMNYADFLRNGRKMIKLC